MPYLEFDSFFFVIQHFPVRFHEVSRRTVWTLPSSANLCATISACFLANHVYDVLIPGSFHSETMHSMMPKALPPTNNRLALLFIGAGDFLSFFFHFQRECLQTSNLAAISLKF
jgi:hypothetical protein